MKESEELYRLFFDNALDGMLLADAETQQFYASNEAMGKMLGYTPEEIRTLRVPDIHPKESLPYALEQFERLLKQKTKVSIDVPIKRKNGTSFYADISAFSATFDGRKCLFGVFRDVTELRQAQRAITMERDRMRQFLDVVEAIIVVIQADESISLMNRKGCEILGYQDKEILGKNWFDTLIPPRDRKRVRGVFAKVMKGETEPVEFYCNHVLSKGGEERTIAWHNAALRDEKGNIYAALSYGQDITERIDVAEVKSETDIIKVRVRAKAVAESLGFNYMDQTRIASAVLELARNAFQYAGGGKVSIQPVEREGRGGIEIIVEDHGPGIANLELALKGGYSTSGALGEGLSTCKKLMDEFDIKTKVSEGTLVRITKWL